MPMPNELKNNALWCGWKREIRNDNPTKVPYNPRTVERASTADLSTFGTFDEVNDIYIGGYVDGFGIAVTNGFSAIDIDHCISEDGCLSDTAEEICTTMKSYAEKSPSGSGVRIIFKSPNLVYDKNKYYIKNPTNGIEIYVEGATNRFVTITGNTLYGYPIIENAEALQYILDKYMLRPVQTKRTETETPTAPIPVNIPPEDILSKAMRNYKFSSLFNGDMSAYNNDHSSADLALCNMLAFWTGKDPQKMDEFFRKSALYRDKWNRADYRNDTISKAIARCDETYDPNHAQTIWDKLDATHLQTDTWTVSADGVSHTVLTNKKTGDTETYVVTSTPIAPAAYLENPETGECKIEIHYMYNGQQRSFVCEKETVLNKTKIVKLANRGINVTSASANELTKYFSDMERLNANRLPHYISTSHLGWSGDDFVPYNSKIKFDGEEENKSLYQAVTQSGELSEWVQYMHKLRENLYFRLIMAASFASPLIQICGCLPFWFHLWGTSGTGKTVALMAAMSVWGDPKVGKLTQTFDSTTNALMSTVGFLHNLPMGIDELQTIKNSYASYDDIIMKLTEGKERARMQFNKLLPARQWHCAFISTGEEPITADNAGGGTKNRVIEVEIDNKFFGREGNAIVSFITNNYGTAGKAFVENIPENVTSTYQAILGEVLNSTDTTDKQAMAATLILLADKIACDTIFKGETPLTIEDIAPFIKSPEEADVSVRAYDWVKGWIAKNENKFYAGSYGDILGKYSFDGKSLYIIASELTSAMKKEGFSFDAVKKRWSDRGWIRKHSSGYKVATTINKMKTGCIEFTLE